ncbi:MAG: tetratricopeptide repeat protein, partial [Proteobacteria bacterium]|nr:tetratricopeptide repeat protein [Pseudomonadota bacterium]
RQRRQETATQQRQESGEPQIQAKEEPGQGDQENKEKAAPKHSDRNLAKALFLAKRGRPSSARYLPLFGLGTVAVLLAGLAGYFYLLPGGGLEFSVPSENNLAIGPTSPALPEITATELSPGIEVANAAIAAATAAEEIVPVRSGVEPSNGSSQAISQVIGGPVENNAIIESPVETEPPLSNLQPSTIDTAVDSSPISASAVEVAVLPEIVPSTTTAGMIADSAASADATEPVDRISFSRQQVISSIDPLASEAYAAYRRGNLDEAEGLYRQVLIDSPRHRDALLGLVAIATGKDETGVAMDLYSQLLDRDPADPVAHAGLLELMPPGSAVEQERQLKRLAQRHPEVAPLAYALGNFYASGRRWTDAQKAYFRALRLAKNEAVEVGYVNPDYAYNLAISLEHMNQAQAARDYYQQALDFADNHPAGFDLNVVRGRLENISRMASR